MQNLINSLGQFTFILSLVIILSIKSKKFNGFKFAKVTIRTFKRVNKVERKAFRKMKGLDIRFKTKPVKSKSKSKANPSMNPNVIQLSAYRKQS